MHDQLFARSIRPDSAVVLLLPLKPYSLGHELELQRADNALTKPLAEWEKLSDAARREALVAAVDICSQSWRELCEGSQLLEIQPAWNAFRLRLKQRKLLKNWRKWKRLLSRFNDVDWLLSLADFRAYQIAGRTVLPVISSADEAGYEAFQMANSGKKIEGGRQPGAPLLAQLINFAHARCLHQVAHVDSVFDIPFSLCCNLFYAELEYEGGLYIENEKEARVAAEMVEHRAQIARENKAAGAAWAACETDEQRTEAIKSHPRILNLFPAEAIKFIKPEGQCHP